MERLSTIFAWTVAVLAGLAVIGAIAYAITWEVCAICRTLADYRARTRGPSYDPTTRYWPEHAHVRVIDGITDEEADQVHQMAARVLAGDRLQEVAQETRP